VILVRALSPWFSLVRFGHSVFALPFALASAWLAAGAAPPARVLLLVVLCAVAARTAAMAFNRLLDRRLDALNPRTRGRELPRGVLAPRAVALLVLASAAAFVGGACALNPLCGWLSFPVLAVLLGYSAMKRVHWSAHFVLGLSLALAPLGAWLAVAGDLGGDLWLPFLLSGAVLSWVAGFDLIYACLDQDFDRDHGLHSIPARFGVARSLALSSALHGATVALLLVLAWRAQLGWAFGLALSAATVLLVWQHRIVSPGDLSRANLAFFGLNGWVGLLLFAGVALDLSGRGGTA
jgi:4-hydroxybenzoate polyprenyltransferase